PLLSTASQLTRHHIADLLPVFELVETDSTLRDLPSSPTRRSSDLNGLVDFLGATDSVVLTFTVTIDDGTTSVSQDVVITINGTNDRTSTHLEYRHGTVTETDDTNPDADPAPVLGTISYSDVDLSDD